MNRHGALRGVAVSFVLALSLACGVGIVPAQDLDPSGGTYKPPPSQRRRPKKPVTRPTTHPEHPDRPDPKHPTPPQPEPEPEPQPEPSTSTHEPPAEAARHFDAGSAAYDRNDLEKAVTEFEAAIKLDGQYVDALVELGAVLYDLSDLDAAVEAWERGLRLDPSVPELHSNLANASYVRRDYDRALKEYRETLKLRPSSYDALFGLGNSLAALKRYDEAIPYFNQAIQMRGTPFPDARSNLAWAFLRAGKLDDAVATARLAIDEIGAQAPQSVRAWYALAAALTEKADYAGASTALRTAISVCATCPSEQVSRLDYSLGRVLEAKGDQAAAADAYEQYLRLAPYVTNADDVRQKIERLRGTHP